MTASCIRVLEFCPKQWVGSVNGEGSVRSYTPEAESWIYRMEMTLGSESNFGRVNAEPTVVLDEADLRAA